MIDWKEVSRVLSGLHTENGQAAVDKTASDVLVEQSFLVNTTPEDEILELAGKEIAPKKIRRFTWDRRKKRHLTRGSGVLWTYYDEDTDTSYMGTGALVTPRVLNKVKEDSILRGLESTENDG
mgnify:CR=1 FL=1